MTRAWTAAVLLAVLTAWSGCAAMMRQPPAENRRVSDPPVCSTGRGGVALDTLVAVGFGAGTLAAIEADEESAAVGLGLVGALFIASAVSGHRAAEKCEEAISSFSNYRDAVRAEARDRRADARQAQATPDSVPVLASDPDPHPDPVRDPDPDPDPDSDPEDESEHEHEPAKPPVARKPPVPGSQAWREFWIEVAP